MLADVLQRRRREIDRLTPLRRRPWSDRVATRRVHLRGSAAGHYAPVRMCADHRNGVQHRGVQRQRVVPVAQQDDAFFGNVLGIIVAFEGVNHHARHRRMIDHAGRKHGAQQPVHHVIEPAHGHGPRLHGVAQRLAEVFLAGLLLIESRQRCLDRRVRGLPVGDDKPWIVPFSLQHLVQQVIVLTGPIAMDFVVRAHHRGRLPDTDADLKRQQITLVHRLAADLCVHRRASGLLVVHRVMLDVAHHPVLLDTHDQVADRHPGKHRILAGVFE